MTDEGGFKITDRRTSWNMDDPKEVAKEVAKETPKETCSQPKASEPVVNAVGPRPGALDDGEELPQELSGELPLMALPMNELAGFFISTLFQKTFINLGMGVGEDGQRLPADFGEAQRAIALAACLVKHMEGKWGDLGMEKELETQLASMKLAYARMAPAER